MDHSVTTVPTVNLSPDVLELNSIERGSAVHRAMCDPVLVSYGLAGALVNSVLLPKSARGVEQHERLINGTIPDLRLDHVRGRITDTIDLLFGIVFSKESRQASNALHELHRKVGGKMQDGSDYHAWEQETWTNTWFVQVRAFMDAYGALRGYEDETHRFAVYRGFVELGRRFRVRMMPESLEDCDAHWENLKAEGLAASPAALSLIAMTTSRCPKPESWDWMPTPIWALISLPFRRIARVGVLLSVPPALDESLGIKRGWLDRFERSVHRIFWKMIPRRLAQGIGERYFEKRFSAGTHVWHTRYSKENLKARRSGLEI